MRLIEILVSPQGSTSVTTKGFAGPSCREASQFLEQALGQPAEEHRTAEFHQSQEVHESQRQLG